MFTEIFNGRWVQKGVCESFICHLTKSHTGSWTYFSNLLNQFFHHFQEKKFPGVLNENLNSGKNSGRRWKPKKSPRHRTRIRAGPRPTNVNSENFGAKHFFSPKNSAGCNFFFLHEISFRDAPIKNSDSVQPHLHQRRRQEWRRRRLQRRRRRRRPWRQWWMAASWEIISRLHVIKSYSCCLKKIRVKKVGIKQVMKFWLLARLDLIEFWTNPWSTTTWSWGHRLPLGYSVNWSQA